MSLDLMRLGALVVAVLAVVSLDTLGLPLAVPRAIAGIAMTLYVPGAALLLLVRPRLLARPTASVIAVPISIALAALTAIAVDRLPLPLAPGSLMLASVLLTGLLLLGCAWADMSGRPTGPGARGRSRGPWPFAPNVSSAVRGRSLIGRSLAHVREPLFLHAYALGISGAITSGLGVVYWGIAARLYPTEVVGVNAALLSLVTLLGNVAQLNLRSGFGRFVPLAGPRVVRLLGWGYAAAIGVAILTGFGVVALLLVAPRVMEDVEVTPLLAVLFPITVLGWAAFTIQDHALTALRKTTWVPIENAVFSVMKIVLLVAFVGAFGAYGILASWTVPMLVLVAIVTTWVFRSLAPARARASARRAASGEEATPPLALRTVVSFVGVDYLGSLFAIGSTSLLPAIVLSVLGAATSAHFYIVVLVASAAQLLPAVLTTSLLVEASAAEATFERDGRRVLRLMALILVPLVLVLVLAAPLILGIFGADYSAEGTTALRLYAIASLPYALVQLAFIRLRLEQRVRWVLVVQVVLAAALVVGSLVLLPILGIAATGLVTLVSQGLVASVLVRAELWDLFAGRGREAPASSDPHPTAGRDAPPPGADDAAPSAPPHPRTSTTRVRHRR